jgi:hypothetical protein
VPFAASAYEVSAPPVSHAIGWLRGVTSNPNIEMAFAGVTTGSSSSPSLRTRNTSIRALARSRTSRCRPSGVKRTAAAPSAPGASGRTPRGSATSRAPATTRNPLSVLSSVLSA